jgi:YfiH family protein
MSWTLDTRSIVPHWRPAMPPPDRVLAFSTRAGGVSAAPFDSLNLGRSTDDRPDAVRENRRRLLAALALDPDHLATAGQVHGATVARTSAPGHTPGHDALVSDTPGLVLAVTTADCMALLYSAGGAVAAAHAGWRGTADGMPVATLNAVCALARVSPSAVEVHIGPCIRVCCYEVGPEVAERFPAEALRHVEGRPRLDLPRAARLQLRDAGVADDRIHDTGACTACEPAWYFSHRRDRGLTGRHWGLVALAGAAVGGNSGGGV